MVSMQQQLWTYHIPKFGHRIFVEPGNPNIRLLGGVESVGRGSSNFRLGTVKLSGTSHDGPMVQWNVQNIQNPCKYYQIDYRNRMVGRISFLNKYFHDISDDVLIWWLRLSETLHEILKIQLSIYQLFLLNLCLPFLNKKHVMRCAIFSWERMLEDLPCLKKGETVEVCQKTQLQRFGEWRSKARCTIMYVTPRTW